MFFRLLASSSLLGAGVIVAHDPAAPVSTPVTVTASAPSAAMTTFEIDAVHSQVMFKVRHLGLSTVTGRFGKFSGTFQMDPATGQAGAANLRIETASVNTDNERRDGHLRSADFFAADSFPTITFASTGITKGTGNMYRVMGNLTMRGVTRPVTLNAEFAGARMGAQGGLAAVNMTGTIKRKEFGLMWDRVTEGISAVGDDVQLLIEVEAKSKP
jgi:polyisoprenoid-binding protein YceI